MPHDTEALTTLDRLGIVADFFCLLFHPWSTPETIATDLAFLEQAIPPVTPPSSASVRWRCTPARHWPTGCKGKAQEGHPWPLAYEIADPRAELLRRLNTLIFGGSTTHDRIRDRITQAWFALLLAGGSIPRSLTMRNSTGSRRWWAA